MASKAAFPDLSEITTFVLDVDGVLTDGTMLAFADGEQVRAFNIKDGYAIKHALKKGYKVAIISGRNEVGVRRRLESLDVEDIFLGVENKLDVFQNYLYLQEIDPENVIYMGDDMPDYEVMQHAGLAVCPADAATDILEIADYVTNAGGGKGAVREIIELVLKNHQEW